MFYRETRFAPFSSQSRSRDNYLNTRSVSLGMDEVLLSVVCLIIIVFGAKFNYTQLVSQEGCCSFFVIKLHRPIVGGDPAPSVWEKDREGGKAIIKSSRVGRLVNPTVEDG